MSFVGNEKHYLELIRQLLDKEIDGETFCSKFEPSWMADRNEEYAISDTWPERYDLQLIESYRQGAISSEEFERKWVELWGYGGYRNLVEMLGCIFTACDVFFPVPEREYEIDESQLRIEVEARLTEYEAKKSL